MLVFFFICRRASEEQERRDYELAVRLAQVSDGLVLAQVCLCATVWNGLCTVFCQPDISLNSCYTPIVAAQSEALWEINAAFN